MGKSTKRYYAFFGVLILLAALAAGLTTAKTAVKREKAGKLNMEIATFAAGCFWGVEERFRTTEGVVDTAVGYTGGHTKNPTYKEVCSDTTGHAEAVQVTFDPKKISYKKLLAIFWDNHNPTQIDRQGPDRGKQYRSAIFYHTPEQQKQAEESKEALQKSGKYSSPIATQIVPATEFYMAEDYHQQYLQKRGSSFCHF